MKELNFYKYCDDETNNLHYWETETHTTLDIAEPIIENLTMMFPNATVSLLKTNQLWCRINVKFYSSEDSDLFCVLLGG